MKIISKITQLALVQLVILISADFTQAAESKYELLFKSGRFIPEANLEATLQNPEIYPDEVFGGVYFRLLQFEEIPGELAKTQLNASGIRLISYFPNYAYMASINRYADLSVLRTYKCRAVLKIDADYKLSNLLKGSSIPDHARYDDKHVDVTIRYYRGLEAGPVTAALLQRGATLLRRYDYGNWMEVRIEKERIAEFAALSFVAGIEPIAPPSEPDDERGRSLHRSNVINSYTPMGRHYDGTGVSAALADDGPVGPHIDYQGRIDQSNTTANNGNHGDMTTGILMGAGNIDPTIRGMGTGAFIYIYDIGSYNHVLNSPTTNATLGVMVTSTSYSQGCNDYTTDTQTGDQILHDNPTLLHVYSAGNNSGADCGYGAGAGWGNITGGFKQGKNVIACANVNYLDVLDGTSSHGPASDGRVKPDISANGAGQLSTDGPNDYQVGGGTSAACPGVAGIVTQLHQAYRELNGGQNAEGALIKACLLNTADEIGNPGPDFKFGWGRVNAFKAVTTLEENRYLSDVISQGATNTHNITVPANTQLVKIMVLWSDEGGDPIAAKSLVNDLNMVVTDANGNTWNPWVLDETPTPAALNSNAVRGIDDLNNMEQFTLDNPPAGNYTINIDGFLVPQGPQKYYIVYEFSGSEINVTYPIGNEGFVPGETETIRWDAYGTTGTFTVEYSDNDGASWNMINNAVAGNVRQLDWNVPSTITSQALIKITRGAGTGQSPDNFSIVGTPQNFEVDWACPDSIRLKWSALTGVVGYEISMLGSMYMDSIAYSTTNSVILSGLNPMVDQWFSVRGIFSDGMKGRRAMAIYKAPGIFSCPIAVDASVNVMNSPQGTLNNCHDLTASVISVNIENSGINSISNIPVFYSVNNGPVISETVTGSLNSFASIDYDFTATFDFSVAGTYELKVWTDYVADGNSFNDTIISTIEVLNGNLVTLPYSENFESFALCGTNTDCELTVCALPNGWVNETNLQADDIDWRTSEGSTPSVDTGPDADHNPGTTTGNYLYLEASTCFNKQAEVVTPCFDLTTASLPELSFWYHMFGASMGTLHVDIFANDVWQNDVIPALTGNLGTQWNHAVINLAPFAGGIINVRFRGITGNDYTSDMAIDDIGVYEINTAPQANFNASNTAICANETITLNDMSINSPNAWLWTITPATGYTYVNGTSATSQNPQVQFTANGTYDVSLDASNAFGTNTYTEVGYIEVGGSALIPVVETFQGGVFPPAKWKLENPDNGTTWSSAALNFGPANTPTTAAFMNNFVYSAAGQEDGLVTERIDLTAAIAPVVTFDVSHARYSAAFEDALRIDVSVDCGVTYTPTAYFKQGVNLATVPDQTATFVPAAGNQWRNDTLDLLPFAGNKIHLKFVNITGYGNSLYLDNINYSETSTGIAEHENGYFILNVYPNPGNGVFNVIANSSEEQQVSVVLTDLKGAMLDRSTRILKPGGNQFQQDLTHFGKGVYFLQVQAEKSTQTFKLVVL